MEIKESFTQISITSGLGMEFNGLLGRAYARGNVDIIYRM